MDATLDPFTQTILSILEASPAIRARIGRPAGDLAAVVPGGPQEAPPQQISPDVPQTPEPPPAPPVAPATAAMEQGPIGRLLGLSPEATRTIRSIGAGMSSIRGNPYGDPFITAAQGFGGAQGYQQQQDDTAAATATANEKTAYDRSQTKFEQDRQARLDAENSMYKRLAEDRASKTSDMANRKSAMEIKRMARNNGISDQQMLEIERIAQAAGENMTGEKRQKAIDETRQRLLDQLSNGQGISGAGNGVSAPYTSTNPNTGQTLEYRDGQWVDQETGEPYPS